MFSDPITMWHQQVNRNEQGLDALLAEDVIFYSPVVHTPQVGKSVTQIFPDR